MNKVEAIIREEMVKEVTDALAAEGFVGLNVSSVMGRGAQRGVVRIGRTAREMAVDMLRKAKLEMVVADEDTDKVRDIIVNTARTGEIGDGKIFVVPVAQAIRVRTGETGESAL